MRKCFVGSVLALIVSFLVFAEVNGNPQGENGAPDLKEQLVELKARRLKIISKLGQAHPMVNTLSARIDTMEDQLVATDPEYAKQLEALKLVNDPAARTLIEKLLHRIERLEQKIEESRVESRD